MMTMTQSHTNGLSRSATLIGLKPVRQTVEGPGFRLHMDGLDVRVEGTAAPEQVLRLLSQSRRLGGAVNDVVAVRIETTSGWDEYRYTADLRHRLLFRRSWGTDGPRAVFYGLNPFVADTDGPVAKVPGRASLRNVVGILSRTGPLSQIDVMNVFTFRSAAAASLPARPQDRVAVPELEREVLAAADVVLLAWGSKIGAAHRPYVEHLLDVLDSVGVAPTMLERDGALLTVGSPPQPAHPARLGYRGIRAVVVDRATVLGQDTPLLAGISSTHVDSPPEGSAPPSVAPVEPRPRPVPTGVTASDRRIATLQGQPLSTSHSTLASAIAWYEAHLDALGRDALWRLLDGEQHGVPHPSVPTPEVLLSRAHERGGPWDALDLAVAAHRIVSGIAWRWIGARYLLDNPSIAPDLEDLQTDGKRKVTGRPYAQAARDAITRLVDSTGVAGNELAAANRKGVDFAQLAGEWRVSHDLIGATLGPGSAQWVDLSKTVPAGTDSARGGFRRVVAERAEWVRDS
jgi:hypothetical protein